MGAGAGDIRRASDFGHNINFLAVIIKQAYPLGV
jgi:hypothetical protein